MKSFKRILVILLAAAMLLPMAITTSFAEGSFTDNWMLFAGRYASGGLMAQRTPKGFSLTENDDGSISIYSPTWKE
ncbi:MAG: hypothetical protein IJR90_05735, partial [Clostridia bacterium]|nr:hypothetical protein [Clostridia bacterium]